MAGMGVGKIIRTALSIRPDSGMKSYMNVCDRDAGPLAGILDARFNFKCI